MSTRITGTVKFFDANKGFGFIEPSNGDKDIFIHAKVLQDHGGFLEKGQKIEFETRPGRKDLEADNITIINQSG